MKGFSKLFFTAVSVPVALLPVFSGALQAADNSILLPAVTIYPDQILMPKHFKKVARPSHLPMTLPLLEGASQIRSKVSSRVLPAGRPVLLAYLRQVKLVRAGMTVNVIYRSGGISITAVAQALSEGAEGDLIMARNLQSGNAIRGVVQHDGSLRVLP